MVSRGITHTLEIDLMVLWLNMSGVRSCSGLEIVRFDRKDKG